jgi:hypothetical protein
MAKTIDQLKWEHTELQLRTARTVIDDLRQQLQDAGELAANNWELAQGLSKHCGAVTAALQAANERAAEAVRHLRAVLVVEGVNDGLGNLKCPWCKNTIKGLWETGHSDTCPRRAAAAWLEAGEGKGLEDKE